MITKPFRLLPATIIIIASLLGLKSLELVRAATPSTDTPSQSPIAQSAAAPQPTQVTPAPATTPADYDLLQQLRKRREELDARAHSLDDRQAILSAEEVKLQQRVNELQSLQTKLEQEVDNRQKSQDAAWSNLVKLYEAMRPRDAAKIFDDLDMPVLIELARRMNERKAAAILASMQPDRARDLTARLAQLAFPANKGT